MPVQKKSETLKKQEAIRKEIEERLKNDPSYAPFKPMGPFSPQEAIDDTRRAIRQCRKAPTMDHAMLLCDETRGLFLIMNHFRQMEKDISREQLEEGLALVIEAQNVVAPLETHSDFGNQISLWKHSMNRREHFLGLLLDNNLDQLNEELEAQLT